MTSRPNDPRQELNDVRAALMNILRLRPLAEPGPDGIKVLRPPPDHGLLAGIHRLRQFANEPLGQADPDPEH
jgi:hypothetical protein